MSAVAFKRSASVIALAGAAAWATIEAMANPVTLLPGRWAGPGTIAMSNGEVEQMRCVATYFVEKGGAALRQNLRCASQGYKIDAITNLTVSGSRVAGSWEERTWATTGSIKGDVQGDGFALQIDGPGFTAAMAVKTNNCNQSISISPRGNAVSRISMNLGKC